MAFPPGDAGALGAPRSLPAFHGALARLAEAWHHHPRRSVQGEAVARHIVLVLSAVTLAVSIALFLQWFFGPAAKTRSFMRKEPPEID